MATLPRQFSAWRLPSLEIPTPEIPETPIPEIPALRQVTPFADVLADRVAEAIKSTPSNETLAKPQAETRGRKFKWDWEEAISGVWDRVAWRGEAKPKHQADVERLLHDWFVDKYDGAPAQSEIRKRAQRIWRRMNKE